MPTRSTAPSTEPPLATEAASTSTCRAVRVNGGPPTSCPSLIPQPGRDQPLEWKSLGLLELAALPTIGAERWVPWVREADVLLVDGGDATYLCHWIQESGLAELLPLLTNTTWVG